MKKLLIIATITFSTFLIFFSFNKIVTNTLVLEKNGNKIYGIKNFDSAPEASASSTIPQAGIKVTRVVDGDTIEIEGGQRVRYVGIDTPETVHPQKAVECFGKEASLKNKELVEGKLIRLEKDVSETDKYGRLLRYVYIDNLLVNDFLVRQGYAHSSSYPPDITHQEEFKEAELEAYQGNRGLWSACQPGSENLNESASTIETGPNGCSIKGNISSSGEKIYHMNDQKFYQKTVIDPSKSEKWFCTEDDAKRDGFRKSKT